MNSRKPRSSERVPRTLADGALTEGEQNRTAREQIWNGYRTDMERVWTGYQTDTERERERVQNGNRMRSVKRSLSGFF